MRSERPRGGSAEDSSPLPLPSRHERRATAAATLIRGRPRLFVECLNPSTSLCSCADVRIGFRLRWMYFPTWLSIYEPETAVSETGE